jgi:hypothetical protein
VVKMILDQGIQGGVAGISGMINTCGWLVHTLRNGRAAIFAKVSFES